MQIALELKSMEPQKSEQRLAFTYLVSSTEFGDLELKLLIQTQSDLTDALRTACQVSPIPTAEKIRPHP